MSRLKKGSLPSYRYHKARNCAVVTIDGHDHYAGASEVRLTEQVKGAHERFAKRGEKGWSIPPP